MGPRVLRLVLVVVLLLGAGLAATWASRRWASDGPLSVTGTVEALQVDISPKIAGRIVERPVREGDRVRRGQLLVRLDAEELEADTRRAEAAARAAEARLRDLKAGARQQEIDEARANLRNAAATRVWTERDFARAQALFGKDLVAMADVDRVRQAFAVAVESETAAGDRLDLLLAGPRADTVAAAEADLAQARASLAMVRKRLAEMRLQSPLDGVVLHKHMEVGETVNPGVAILTLVDLTDMWLRAYVSETDLGRVKIGQPAAITVDAFPGRTFPGTVTEIASQAEFTPKNVQTKKERVNLVFRIKIAVQNADGTLKPGLPADAELRP
jgi:HlyD family secretion protein